MESNVKRQTVNKHNLKDYVRIYNYICILCRLSKKSHMKYLMKYRNLRNRQQGSLELASIWNTMWIWRVWSSGMWRRAVWYVGNELLKEPVASISRVGDDQGSRFLWNVSTCQTRWHQKRGRLCDIYSHCMRQPQISCRKRRSLRAEILP
jgi:hypothetical protein